MTTTASSTAQTERALALLGSGVGPESVAAALGVTPAAISQLLANDDFADKVSQLRYTNLQKHNVRDTEYDEIEDKLLRSLKDKLPLMFRPIEILSAIKVVNGAKRRGQSAPEQVTAAAQVATLVLPDKIVQNFTVNNLNQVIIAGGQNLETIAANTLLKQTKQKQEAELIPSIENLNYDEVKAG